MITTDIIIIGAGPTGLFAVFEAPVVSEKREFIPTATVPTAPLVVLTPP